MISTPDISKDQGSPGSGSPIPRCCCKAPPGSPHVTGTKVFVGPSVGTQTVLEFGSVTTFSAKTCCELLSSLTPDQLAHEIRFNQDILGNNFDFRHRKPNDDAKSRALSVSLAKKMASDIETLKFDCSTYESLIYDFSCTIEKAQNYINEMSLSRDTSSTATTEKSTASQLGIIVFQTLNRYVL